MRAGEHRPSCIFHTKKVEIREVIQGYRTGAEFEPVGSPVSLLDECLPFIDGIQVKSTSFRV